MTLTVGSRIGPYEIVAPLGAGGMGEVYRARDTKLNRDVAIKVLPAAVATDRERLARFEREAQVLAALNHPNIAAVYAVETSGDAPAIVMELVAGEDLSAHIARGPIPLAEALLLARQIADALAAAHEAGIIHRDLKPANIKVKDNGTVKVLDFGLAKALAPDGASATVDAMNSPTISAHATRQGVILGTAAYMAPEQARGKAVDKRADIWAFGVVLYEMLTGNRLFAADEASDTLAHVLTKEPDWTALPATTPPRIRELLRHCLTKDAKQRLRDIGDARLEIDEAAGPAVEPQPTRMASAHALHRERLAWATVLAAALLALATVAYFGGGSRPLRPAVTQSLISVAPADRLPSYHIETEGRPSATAMALSPNGRTVVFSAVFSAGSNQPQLFRRDLDKLEAVPMAGTERASSPFFSPDGEWVGFFADSSLRKVALSGGPVTKVCDVGPFSGASWGSGGMIVYALQSGGLWLVPSGGGTGTSLTTLDSKAGEYGHWLPHFLPDGKAVVFTVVNHFLPDYRTGARLWLVGLSGERRELGLGEGADARYAPSGHLVFVRSGTLVAAPFDVAKREVTGDSLTVLDDVMQAAYTPRGAFETGAGQFSLSSESGALVYLPGGVFPDSDQPIVSVDRVDGTTRVLPGMPPRRYLAPRISPDQSKLVVWSQGVDRTVWTYDIPRGTLTPLTTAGRNSWAIWTPDGKQIAFSGSSGGGADSLFLMPADGSGKAEPLTTPEAGTIRQPSSWNGRTLAFIETNAGTGQGFTVMTLSLDGDRRPAPFLPAVRYATSTPEFSPDGRYLAYTSFLPSSPSQVYVRPYPGPGGGQPISNGGGAATAPAWSPDGRELFYVAFMEGGIRMMAVPILTKTPSLAFGQPHELFHGKFKQPTNIRNYDVTKDGQRFFLTRLPESQPIRVTQMILVQNWFEELRAKVPSGR